MRKRNYQKPKIRSSKIETIKLYSRNIYRNPSDVGYLLAGNASGG